VTSAFGPRARAAAFRDAYAAAVRGTSEEWKAPRRVEVDAVRAQKQAEKDAAAAAEDAAVRAMSVDQLRAEVAALRAEKVRTQAAAAAAAAAAADATPAGESASEKDSDSDSD
jgi:hypothetical protein